MAFIRRRPLISLSTGLCALGGSWLYVRARDLERKCPSISVQQIPRGSACQHFIETVGEPLGTTLNSSYQPRLVAAWTGTRRDRWVPYCVAIQKEVPLSIFSAYGTEENDAKSLATQLMRAFCDARAKRPESVHLFKDDIVCSSFEPGTPLYGKANGLSTNVLGVWSMRGGSDISPPSVSLSRSYPVAEFPTNEEAIRTASGDSAGIVTFWSFPSHVASVADKAASYGYPWRFMLGGFHELIVEKSSEDTARITYVMLECYHLYPNGQAEPDFKTTPQWTQKLHRLYAQDLLEKAVQHIDLCQRAAER
ncbi:hypothetical protein BKA67DRAFT_557557 [Truncatella angustata]|uniref:Uncharacterized protein n=1 Tax=Truncatella angustata TaxID=152316 RepID=A0A9P9A2J0_9PEZI|nr:uncharacterized protein BKA67DRAFT_557557 [Truncatella angustata]KAH6658266.1 hypothetical protein BKA67DRAFT_557557 [Truncatella angustata]